MTARRFFSHARYAILLFPIYGAFSSFVQGCGGAIESHGSSSGEVHCDDDTGGAYGYGYGYEYGDDSIIPSKCQ